MNIFLRTKASFLKKIHNLEMGNRGHSFLCRQGLMLITQAYHIQYKVSKFTLGELNAKVFLSKLERSERFFQCNRSLQFTPWREQLQTGNRRSLACCGLCSEFSIQFLQSFFYDTSDGQGGKHSTMRGYLTQKETLNQCRISNLLFRSTAGIL